LILLIVGNPKSGRRPAGSTFSWRGSASHESMWTQEIQFFMSYSVCPKILVTADLETARKLTEPSEDEYNNF
jgi:hypothetical protein